LPHSQTIPIPGSSSIERVLENIGAAKVTLSDDEFAEINDMLKQFETAGKRYGEQLDALSWGRGRQ
jgi:aryl-alcohol dehydrogenase-like predicted oxidoreductase